MVRKLEVLWKRQVGKDNKYFRVKEPPVDRVFPENPQWVNEWIQGLFNRDWRAFKILQLSIYCPRTQAGPQNNISYEYTERICYFYGSIKIEEEVERYLNNHQCGAVAVAVFDPDISPAPDGVVDSFGSDETPVDQDPPHQLLGVGEDKQTHQVQRFPTDSSKLQYSSPKKIHTEAGNVEMSNHSKWVESRLEQGHRKPKL
ncbi:uncharacterized protein N7479_001648 [Penicillium vulpinum]|uniref:uncharacterized protein n=1 Tax=Penicillium vulpinum TaxID=29845 RepID=UPI0025483791|nr:uncharacterized protein N7479_001648 [Penicillium vulpinum]KAJ5971730.1 hypothetical protein N7479_001648 [Penicillium vulpinum]